mmetsp:Transcript_21393/g.43277  ORF Transcript_21393/g.43277 Transcript_21393/m.43277 type:complete len:344 (-) Transcript_21393:152-1183(-)
MDQSEAANMIKTLEATAKDAQQKRWRREKVVAAKRARAIEKEEMATSQVSDRTIFNDPRPIDWQWLKEERRGSLVLEGVQKEKRTRDKREGRDKPEEKQAKNGDSPAGAEGSKPANITAAPSPAPAPAMALLDSAVRLGSKLGSDLNSLAASMATGGLLSRRGSKTERQRNNEQLATAILLRIQRTELTFTWNTWMEYWQEYNRKKAILIISLRSMGHVAHGRGYRKWKEYAEGSKHSRYLIRRALAHLARGQPLHSIYVWQQGADERRRSKELLRIARQASARIRRPQVLAAMRVWQGEWRLARLKFAGSRSGAPPWMARCLYLCRPVHTLHLQEREEALVA